MKPDPVGIGDCASSRRRATSRSSRRGWPRPPSDCPTRQRRPTATSNFRVGSPRATTPPLDERFERPDARPTTTFLLPERSPTRSCVGDAVIHGRARRRLGRARRHVASVLRGQAAPGGARARGRAQLVPRVPRDAHRGVRRVRAEARSPAAASRSTSRTLAASRIARLSADVITILQDRLGLLLRGEIIWQKGRGRADRARGACSAARRTPRSVHLTERVVVVSKGRFDRARTAKARRIEGSAARRDDRPPRDFMSLTLDVWEIAPESVR